MKIEEDEKLPEEETSHEAEDDNDWDKERDGDTKEDLDFEEFSHKDYQLSNLELVRKENMEKNFAIFEEFQINQVKKIMLCIFLV